MSISRGQFLRTFGKSLPGMVLNTGLVGAAGKVLNKMAAASTVGVPQEPIAPVAGATVAKPKFGHINRGPESSNEIAFTFDDGPIPGMTELILDEFKKRNVHASFFMIGSRVERSPELARRVLAEGHDVGNHTYTHLKLPSLCDADADNEIAKTQSMIASALGTCPGWFRPPFGEFRDDQAELLERHGLRSVMGDVSPQDWSEPGEDVITSRILEKTTAGSIIICHDFATQTVNVLGHLLDTLMARGLKPVTLSKLLRVSALTQ